MNIEEIYILRIGDGRIVFMITSNVGIWY